LVTILITGSNGQLGNEFRAIADHFPHFSFIFTDVDELDITNYEKVAEFFSKQEPDVIINCAAYTAVDQAEDEPEKAMWLNRDAVANLARACDLFDCYMVHLSTDYIFDGNANRPYTEDDIPSPASVYGLSKLDGEESMQSCLQTGLIIRTSWLYSSFGNNFVKTILNKFRSTAELSVVADQVGSPTYARDLARTILTIIPAVMASTNLEILHYSNEGQCNWYEFALEIKKSTGASCSIKPVKTTEYPTKAPRPVYSVLDKSKIKAVYGITIPDWQLSLNECLNLIT
jgi:dTDP-4-dehydrorhamnose reductase